MDRVPPHDLDAEASVLGSMMTSPDALTDAILELHRQEAPTDILSVHDALAKRGESEKFGGKDRLLGLLTEAQPSSAAHHAQIVADKAAHRRIIEAAARIVQTAYEPGTKLADLIAQARDELDTITHIEPRDRSDLAEFIPYALDEIEAIADGQKISVPTGFKELDSVLGGLRAGLVHMVFGLASVGTSTLVLDIARSAAIRHGLTTVIFSSQSPQNEVTHRMLSAEARVPLHKLRTGYMNDEDWAAALAPFVVAPSQALIRWRESAHHAEQLHSVVEVVLLDHADQLEGDEADPNLSELAHVYEALTGFSAPRQITEDRTCLKETHRAQ